jgi:uncharacterized membrane protein YfbV (UPF0208 family)
MFNKAVRGFAMLAVVNGLMHLLVPMSQWWLRFYPEKTPSTVPDQFLLTIRVCGAFVTAWALALLNMPQEGLLFTGISTIASMLWYNSFGVNLGSAIATAVFAIGLQGVVSKYLSAGSKMIGAQVPKREVLTNLQGMNSSALKGLAWLLLGAGIQHVLLPHLNWTFFYPKGTPTSGFNFSSNSWMMTIRCFGTFLLSLSAKLMGCPNAGVLTTAGLGILASVWYHDNVHVNPPMAMGIAMLGLGCWGLILRYSSSASVGATSPSARARRNMPIPARVQ